jgi:peptidoglycan/xylan/chitin deacetylase (PgdA/CDA1 family)
MKNIFFLGLSLASFFSNAQPTISFTFDDGNTQAQSGYPMEEWNELILKSLDDANVKAIFFVKGKGKYSDEGQYLLQSWNDRGHGIANHTFNHPYFNNPKNDIITFEDELLRTDALIGQYSQYTKYFRFPYLKEGETPSKIDSIRQILSANGYAHGHVTIDASDWYIDMRLKNRLRENPKADVEGFKEFYLTHLFDRATFYEKIAYELTDRHIQHTLLLHHNLAAALFLDDLIAMFKEKGWNIVSAPTAYEDPIFQTKTIHAGESLIWAMAKDSGLYEKELRYPAEDSLYEEKEMNALGL